MYDIDPIKKVEGSVKSVPTATEYSLSQSKENVNSEFSLSSDSQGRQLTEGQKEYLDNFDNGTMPEQPSSLGEFRYSLSDTEKRLANYTKKQYNDFGWIRANEIVPAKCWYETTPKFAGAKSKHQYYPQTMSKEYIIPASENGDGVNNVLFFMKGTISSPQVSRVVKIDLYDETLLDIARREIYESKGIVGENFLDGILQIYDVRDFSRGRSERGKGGQNSEADGRSYLGRGYAEEVGTDEGEPSVSKVRSSISDPDIAPTLYGDDVRGADLMYRGEDIAPVADAVAEGKTAPKSELDTLLQRGAEVEAEMNSADNPYTRGLYDAELFNIDNQIRETQESGDVAPVREDIGANTETAEEISDRYFKKGDYGNGTVKQDWKSTYIKKLFSLKSTICNFFLKACVKVLIIPALYIIIAYSK